MMNHGRPVGRRSWLSGVSSLALGAACSEQDTSSSVPSRRRASLFIGGDVHLGHPRAGPLFEGLGEVLGGRAGIVNLEGPVGSAPAERVEGGVVTLSNHPDALASLSRANVRAAGIANNHARDLGPSSPTLTRESLVAAGIAVAGEGEIAVLEEGGLRIAITAHDLAPHPPELAVLRAAREKADALIATFHVTGPPSYVPRPELRGAVDLALEAGASIVAAHGTHAVGPVERRGSAIIAWGLGHLVFYCACTEEVDGALLLVTLGGTSIEAAVVPIHAGLRGSAARPAKNAPLMFELLAAIGSSPLEVRGGVAFF